MSKPSIVIDCERYHPRVLHAWAAMGASYDEYEEERSYFEVAGFTPLEKPGDAIPQQSAFEDQIRFYTTALATSVGSEGRVAVQEQLFAFLLRPEFGAYHRRYDGWRAIMHVQCDKLCADKTSTKKLRVLCRRFKRFFP